MLERFYILDWSAVETVKRVGVIFPVHLSLRHFARLTQPPLVAKSHTAVNIQNFENAQ